MSLGGGRPRIGPRVAVILATEASASLAAEATIAS